ncbi:MAG: alginate export family protein [Deltaproteobacteria bacterium]|nr:alginate export family protein [Deltaproteobacteria bacterium]
MGTLRKNIATLLLLNTFLCVPGAAAATPQGVQFSGQARLRVEGDDRTDFANDRDFTALRLRPDILYSPDVTLSILFEPQFAHSFGEALGTQVTSGTTFDNSLSVHQAYIDYHPYEKFQFVGGRQILDYGDQLVIGEADWGTIGRTFDALRTRVSFSRGWWDLFASKIVDNNTLATGSGDINLYGGYVTSNVGAYLSALDFYFYHLRDDSAATALYAPGIRLKSEIRAFDYRIEGVQEWGNAIPTASSSYMADLELGYSFNSSALHPRFSLEGFTTGRNYNQLFPSGHGVLGAADMFSRRNITGGAFHANAEIFDNCSLRLDYFRMYRTYTDATAFKFNGTPLGNSAVSSANFIGDEIDLFGKYRLSRATSVFAGAAVFLKGKYLSDSFAQSWVPTFYYVQLDVKF